MISVEAAALVDDDLRAAVDRLVPQLSRSSAPPSRAVLERIVADEATTLFVARGDSGIVGMLTLATFEIPTGVRAWIEDVVVDESARGQGAGAALSREAIRLAQAAGARTIDLTSRPAREAANRLYQQLGFQLRDTHVYRLAAAGGGSGEGGD